MNGMLSRASGKSPPLLNLHMLQSKAPVQGQNRHCKSWQSGRSVDYLAEPTSVLDIRSPSPTSTLSSSLGGSSESGAVAAVSGIFCEAVSDGQLPDPLLDSKDSFNNPRNASWHFDAPDGTPTATADGGRRVQAQRVGAAAAARYSHKSNNNKWSGEGSTWRPNNGESGGGMVGNPVQEVNADKEGRGEESKPPSGHGQGHGQESGDGKTEGLAAAVGSLQFGEQKKQAAEEPQQLHSIYHESQKVTAEAGNKELQTQGQNREDEWLADLQALSGNEFQMGGGTAATELESMLLESASAPDQSLMRWLLGEIEDPKDPSSTNLPQIKGGGSAHFDDGMDSHFPAGVFGTNNTNNTDAPFIFPTNPVEAVAVGPATPSLHPAFSANPSSSTFCPPYPTLPRLSQHLSPATNPAIPNPALARVQPFSSGSPRGAGLETAPYEPVPNVSCFQADPMFSPNPASLPPTVYGSNPHQGTSYNPDFPRIKMSMDPAASTASQSNIFFPISYPQPQLQTYSDVVGPPQPKRHHGIPELLQRPLQWQHQQELQVQPQPQPGWQPLMQGCVGGGGGLPANPSAVVKQEFMVKPEHAHSQGVLLSLQRRNHIQLPQLQRQKGMNNNIKVGSDEVQLTMVEQLLKAAEAVEIDNLASAQAILARLNQHLSPFGKPLHRAAFYFMEALSSRLLSGNANPLPLSSPIDIVHKISAYKSLSEGSPLSQFANFTANQALLEVLEAANAIHIIDFEVGLGGQWASFLQEIAMRRGGPPSLRLTAIGSNDSMEMHLTRDNLCHFAKGLNIAFEFNVLEVDQIECLTLPMLQLREGEAIALNLSLGMHRLLSNFSSTDSITSLLHLLKQLSPKAIVVVDNESERSGVSFVHQFLEALQFYSFLFDSLDAMNLNMETIHRIEKFLLAPKIENVVAPPKRNSSQKIPSWRQLFIAAGLSLKPFSNITETQAEYLIRRLPVRGFEVIKNHAGLLLCWQGRPLVAASVWGC